ncbi:MAG: PilT/PilU family type 4a pilus ATPase [Planctomycetaceae bacterium]|nr:PilT/PilU family type 4a pilus ATPase [Planctomycetaceae bacterium]
MQINDLLHATIDSGASDLLLAAGAPPMYRIDGELRRAPLESLSPRALEELFTRLMSPEQARQLEATHDVDFAHAVPQLGRFRFNIHRQRGTLAAAIRYIACEVPRLADLHLPPVVDQLTRRHDGLVLVTGQTGSGKTTTLAAMIDEISKRDARHIITLEDPIEFQFSHGRSLVEQREIGSDCPDFASGLKHVLRQDPDVILVGEMRDLETIRTAMQAAETGHLVLATLHSTTAAGAVDRIIEVFPPAEQSQIRSHLAECLCAVLTQRLLVGSGGGRAAAVEVLIATRAIRTSIREGTSHLIPGIISTGRRAGMQTMAQALEELVLNGRILPETSGEQSTHLLEEVGSF